MLLQKSKLYERNIFENLKLACKKRTRYHFSVFLNKYKIYKNLVLLSLKNPELFKKANIYLKNIKIKLRESTVEKKEINYIEYLYHCFTKDCYYYCFLENDRYLQIVKIMHKTLPDYAIKYSLEEGIEYALKHRSMKTFDFLNTVFREYYPHTRAYSNSTILLSNNITALQEYYYVDNHDFMQNLELCLENDAGNSVIFLLNKHINSYGFPENFYDETCNLLSLYGFIDVNYLSRSSDLTLVLENLIIIKRFVQAEFILKHFQHKIWSIEKLVNNKKEKLLEYVLEKGKFSWKNF